MESCHRSFPQCVLIAQPLSTFQFFLPQETLTGEMSQNQMCSRSLKLPLFSVISIYWELFHESVWDSHDQVIFLFYTCTYIYIYTYKTFVTLSSGYDHGRLWSWGHRMLIRPS